MKKLNCDVVQQSLGHPGRKLWKGCPIRIVWSWAEMADPLYSCLDQSPDVGCPSQGNSMGKWFLTAEADLEVAESLETMS